MSDSKTARGDTDAPRPDRRSFLTRIWVGLGAVAVVEYVWMFAEFLRPKSTRAADAHVTDIFVAGPVDRFELESVTAFPEAKLYLARLEDGGFLALCRECTHLGCTVPWVEKEARFVCPCHASAYDMTGRVLNPPAPRPLDLYAVRIENGIVKVDTTRRIRRSTFETDQITIS